MTGNILVPCVMLFGPHNLAVLGIMATLAAMAISEYMRCRTARRIRSCTVHAVATVISVYRKPGNKYTVTYRFLDPARDGEQDDDPVYVIDAKELDRRSVMLQENDEFGIMCDPSNPENTYAPQIDGPTGQTRKGHLISQSLRLIILAQLLLLTRLL